MVQTLKYTLIFTFIIIISSISFAISEETTVPIYLTVPEYLKITDLGPTELKLYADASNFHDTVAASLTFNVESNVNYYLEAEFTVLESLDNNIQNSIEHNYNLSVSGSEGTPGVQSYSLTFELYVRQPFIYEFEGGQIGNIQITVSGN